MNVRDGRLTTIRGRLAGLVILACALAAIASVASAQEQRFFRIGTGGAGGTYFPIGGLLAGVISNPPGARPCDQGGNCGVPGLIAVASATSGSVANIAGIEAGTLESGLSQSDVAHWAYTGTGVYDGKPKSEQLRAIANLYPESIHLVARKEDGIKTVADLKGKRVSLDEPGSGTLVDAKLILAAWGLAESDLKIEYLKAPLAAERLKDGTLDAFFFVGGYPTSLIRALATSGDGIDLVPLVGPPADKLRAQYPFFSADVIPDGTYEDVPETNTLSVGAQWLVAQRIDDALVYEITKALWTKSARKLLDSGHAKGKIIRLETALDGIGIPLHPGAERFYREAGVLK